MGVSKLVSTQPRPPIRSCASRRITERPACFRTLAAVRPAIPAPTMITSTGRSFVASAVAGPVATGCGDPESAAGGTGGPFPAAPHAGMLASRATNAASRKERTFCSRRQAYDDTMTTSDAQTNMVSPGVTKKQQ